MIYKLKEIAKKYLYHLDPAIGIVHMETTFEFSRELASKESADIQKCSICAILHDIGLSINSDMLIETIDDNHGINSAKLARPLLADMEFDERSVDEICDAISTHTYHNMQKTLIARILWDSDKLNVFSEKMFPYYIDYWMKNGLTEESSFNKVKQASEYYFNTFYTQTAKDTAKSNFKLFE